MERTIEIEKLFHDRIPITRTMNVRVKLYDGQRLVLTAPLDANINHLGTAFGGSLNTLAVLSGYGMLWLELQDYDCHIVIRDSSISYERPVTGDLIATCDRPDNELIELFKKNYQQKGKAKIAITATIQSHGEVAVRFKGTFVAIRSNYDKSIADVSEVTRES